MNLDNPVQATLDALGDNRQVVRNCKSGARIRRKVNGGEDLFVVFNEQVQNLLQLQAKIALLLLAEETLVCLCLELLNRNENVNHQQSCRGWLAWRKRVCRKLLK